MEKYKGIIIFALVISVIVSSLFFFLFPLTSRIGNINNVMASYTWCEVPNGIIDVNNFAILPVGFDNIIMGFIAILILAFFNLKFVNKIISIKSLSSTNMLVSFLLWFLIAFSLPITRNALSNYVYIFQIVFISISLFIFYCARNLRYTLITGFFIILLSYILFGLLYMLLLIPLLITLILREEIWVSEKNWNRMLLLSVPLISLVILFMYILVYNMGFSFGLSIINNVFLSSTTLGYPMIFLIGVILSGTLFFVRIADYYRYALLFIVSLFYFTFFGALALAFHFVIFMLLYMFLLRWIINTEWSFKITKYTILSVIIVSIMIFSILSLRIDMSEGNLQIADMDGKIFSVGHQTSLLSCAYDMHPQSDYFNRNDFSKLKDMLSDNEPNLLHNELVSNNVTHFIIDREYLISIVGRDDSGILFVLRVNDDYYRIYPEGFNEELEYYYVYS
jgi:hypothetical protein